ncbi:uncharacterized protein LOC141601869 [Silene latifolia]|uniref:uncharacterized protein LOC141601869 n=1 Tax=Silene latifolia TaxID=37657 RepID=UPI003D77E843
MEVYIDDMVVKSKKAEDHAGALASLGSNFSPAVFDKIPIVHLLEPTIEKPDQTYPINEDTNSWTKPYYDWLLQGTLPKDKNEARALRIKASTYTLINNMVFKKSQAGPYLRCLEPREAKQVIEDIHDGYCRNHKGGRSLASKFLRTGYFLPTLKDDCIAYSSRCEACQIHSPFIHQPSELLHSISAPLPFMKWGMDIVGKLPQAPRQKVFMLAMADYFSKWIEADSYSLVTSTPGYPKANGQAESCNKVVISCLKKKLKRRKGRWAEELPLFL